VRVKNTTTRKARGNDRKQMILYESAVCETWVLNQDAREGETRIRECKKGGGGVVEVLSSRESCDSGKGVRG